MLLQIRKDVTCLFPVGLRLQGTRAEKPSTSTSEKHPLDARDIIKSRNNMLRRSEPGCLQATEGRPHDTDLTTASHDNQSIGFRHVLKMMDNTISHHEHRSGCSCFSSFFGQSTGSRNKKGDQ
ncbi:hypothetical protein CDAR_105731 [Caerostris darwini]|uniref:Uncharacterized protein n=1 Tax=Caerostris darwini TaxID=1538125 RepID=A0AAV4TTI2_9ARAC|nr:hypothetical protein CDAR_105731 [Caerostris darwini]